MRVYPARVVRQKKARGDPGRPGVPPRIWVGYKDGGTGQTMKEFFSHIELLCDLDEHAVQEWAAVCREKLCGRQQIIFLEHEPADAFYIIKSGSVKIYRLAEDGREKVLDVFGPGDFFGEMGLLDHEPRSAGAATLERSLLLVIGKQDFLQLLGKYPQVALRVSQTLSQRLRNANQQIEDFAFRDARSRVIRALLALADQHGHPVAGGSRIAVPVTHQDLAGLAGTSRETVTRVMMEMEKQGLVQHRRRSIILDGEGVRQYFWRSE